MQDFLQIAIYLKSINIIPDFREYNSQKVFNYIEETRKNPKKKWGY